MRCMWLCQDTFIIILKPQFIFIGSYVQVRPDRTHSVLELPTSQYITKQSKGLINVYKIYSSVPINV